MGNQWLSKCECLMSGVAKVRTGFEFRATRGTCGVVARSKASGAGAKALRGPEPVRRVMALDRRCLFADSKEVIRESRRSGRPARIWLRRAGEPAKAVVVCD